MIGEVVTLAPDPGAAPATPAPKGETIRFVEEIEAEIVESQAKLARFKPIAAFLDSLGGQVGPYSLPDPDVLARLIEAWEQWKAANP